MKTDTTQFDFLKAVQYSADEYGMKKYVIVFFKSGVLIGILILKKSGKYKKPTLKILEK